MTNENSMDVTPRGECNDCGGVFALTDVCPGDMACPECGSRDWVNEPHHGCSETER